MKTKAAFWFVVWVAVVGVCCWWAKAHWYLVGRVPLNDPEVWQGTLLTAGFIWALLEVSSGRIFANIALACGCSRPRMHAHKPRRDQKAGILAALDESPYREPSAG
ncbi:MAG: hypothetical protein NTZ65_01875 [Candidatus Berkelbacteria bacterium]|nr:hypothetical protein [Candidatus Berkelbacteria bacterium]